MKNLFLTTTISLMFIGCNYEKQDVKLNEGIGSKAIEVLKHKESDANETTSESSSKNSASECAKACCSEK